MLSRSPAFITLLLESRERAQREAQAQAAPARRDVLAERIKQAVAGREWISSTDLWLALNLPASERLTLAKRITRVMRELGWRAARPARGHKRTRGWRRDPLGEERPASSLRQ
jgi:hypothetical protein